jgi:hypothetical protein
MTLMQATTVVRVPQPQVEVKVPAVHVYTDAGSQVIQIPKTHDQMAALIAQREILSEQLGDMQNQRREIADQYKTAPQQSWPALNAQLADLSTQTIDLQRQINLIGRQIAGASPDLIAMTRPAPPDPYAGTFGEGVGVGALGGIVLATAVMLLARLFRRRFRRDETPATRMIASDDSERLKRLETGIDAMAIEIERISEGQRFVTKLMSESHDLESATRR